MKGIFLASVTAISILVAQTAAAATLTAASCSQSEVQARVNAAAAGDTVAIPSGNCSWQTAVNVSKGITVSGAGPQSTVITINNTTAFKFDVSNGSYRLSNLGITGTIPQYGSAIYLEGINSTIRVDHLDITNIKAAAGTARIIWLGYQNVVGMRQGKSLRGVVDHINFKSDFPSTFLMIYGDNETWKREDDLSSDDFIFLEDSTIEMTQFFDSQNVVFDGEHGARAVLRKNTIKNMYINWHDAGSTQNARSTRIAHVENNLFTCSLTKCSWTGMRFRGGTGVTYGNIIPEGSGYEIGAITHIYRRTDPGGSPWGNYCDGTKRYVCSNFHGHSPSKRATCYYSTQYTDCKDNCSTNDECPVGTSCVSLDGPGAGGYPCRDQTGTGIDNPTNGEQALSPTYFWENRKSSGGALLNFNVRGEESAYIKANRDFYQQSGTFNGTSGVGTGTEASKPSTCTPGVGYWATDTKRLLVCSSSNVWSIHYTPYTYPHPLTGGSPPSVPNAPTSLKIAS